MFAAPGLLYLHMPRTGGTFVSSLLESSGVGTRSPIPEATGHEGIRSLPESSSENNLVFTTLRDPWTWYASIDAHYRSHRRFQSFLHEYFGAKVVGFPDVVRGLTRPGVSGGVNLDKSVRPPGMRLPVDGFARQLATANIGLYTWMILHMFCREPLETIPNIQNHLLQGDALWSVDAVIDTTQLREGLFAVLSSWNEDVAMRMISEINGRPAVNRGSSNRGVLPNGRPDPAHYNPEMQRWVQEADGWAIQRFGFDLPVGQRPMVTLLRR